MKLRNKKTGGIKEFDGVKVLKNSDCTIAQFSYDNLAELNEEWEDASEEEDYEEPKDFWYIDVECGVMCDSTIPDLQDKEYPMKFMKSIGNYFETKEEAEKAVEKLKAWKRLKDKGLEFVELRAPNYGSDIMTIKARCPWTSKNIDDLDLLFGGEDA